MSICPTVLDFYEVVMVSKFRLELEKEITGNYSYSGSKSQK